MSCIAQQFSIQSIPDSLKENAVAVKRFEEITYEIKSPSKGIYHDHYIITILNEAGNEEATFESPYDKFLTINSVSGVLYNAAGKEIKHVKKKDMQDISGTGEENLITDTRYKAHDFYCREYPYSVDYDEEYEFNGIRFFPDWFPQDDPRVAVEFSRYTLIAPKNYEVRYKAFNFPAEPKIVESGDKRIYTWELRGIPARVPEPLAPSWKNLAPFVMIAPSEFEAEGYKGNMSTWKEYGQFMYELIKGRDQLPPDIKQKVHSLTDTIHDVRRKIATLYEFLQKNTRYISVQLGIGGWQPFDANYVASKKYGDCKALSNYMIALLKEAGITGKYVEIRALKHAPGMVTDFSESQFNHVISCVPLNKDTVWLECTSQSLPAGYLSGFTANRYALLIDENGGTVVHTPKYGLQDNLQMRNIKASINEEGNLSATVETLYKGMEQDDLEGRIDYLSKDRQLEFLKKAIDLPTFDIGSTEYKEIRSILPPAIVEKLSISANNYAQISGRRIFVVPNILTKSNTQLKTNEQRKYDIELKDEYHHSDTVEIRVPSGYQPESIPKETRLETEFGKYYSSTKVASDKITYYRSFDQYSGKFPSKDYNNLANFYEQMYKADHSQVVLVKNQ
jgi:hypothetical protein